jgi:hypothetical protein
VSGITEDHVTAAETWLTGHGHSMAGIAHPEGETARFMAAVALELNVPAFSRADTAALMVGVLAYKHSGGKVRTPEVQAAGY